MLIATIILGILAGYLFRANIMNKKKIVKLIEDHQVEIEKAFDDAFTGGADYGYVEGKRAEARDRINWNNAKY